MFEATFATETAGVETTKKRKVDTLLQGVQFCKDAYLAEFGVKPNAAEVELLVTHNTFTGGFHDGNDTVYPFSWSVLDPSIVPETPAVFDDAPIVNPELPADPQPDPNNPIYLYVLLRNDMESLVGTEDKRKTGLPCAQTGHAANQMVYQVRKKNIESLNNLLTEWENETGMGFGTEIVVGAPYSVIKQVVEKASLLGFHAAMTKDPEYPLFDGKTLHLIPVETCGYIFGRKNDLAIIMRQFDLMP